MAATILVPGEVIDSSSLPKTKKGTLTLGPGLRHIPPSAVLSTTAGALQLDHKKSALWLEPSLGRYIPAIGDLVIAQVHRSAAEVFHCTVTPHSPTVLLAQLAFEGATRKTRPNLKSGDLVYARVCKVPSRSAGSEDVEIECIDPSTSKAEGMGPLKGGMAFDITVQFSRRLMMGSKKGGICVLDDLGEKVRFEVAVGRNGRVWVDSGSIKTTIGIGQLLRQVDEQGLSIEDQKKLIKRMAKDFS
ncbi:exosome complex exonuclease-like protein Rrp40 [Polychaeton citri CBS 116435]|uniref:Exosome complex exonuclease-like protein Rrp40 n=1 Tax=Polychaeton citri CBS 116435 TaxID=1314669 RepID=A0A9P4UTF3_9PEZI|nr:exosome complex exonuclease-like protein Rrp40 [Polychaeton citri CBS 116435]